MKHSHMRIRVLMSGGMFHCSGCNPSAHCSLCFCGKGHRAGEKVVMSQYKTTVSPPPPTPLHLRTPRVLSSSSTMVGGGGGLCHSSSVQMDRVREYPDHKSPQKGWIGDHLTPYLQHYETVHFDLAGLAPACVPTLRQDL